MTKETFDHWRTGILDQVVATATVCDRVAEGLHEGLPRPKEWSNDFIFRLSAKLRELQEDAKFLQEGLALLVREAS